MTASEMNGYAGQILRVDLDRSEVSTEGLDEDIAQKYVGGTGLGAKYLYEEVPPSVQWSDPENRMIWTSGPLGGTHVSGTGTVSIVTQGPMTNLAVATQANGFFGAFLKFAGLDGIILQGAAPEWCYLYVRDGGAELRDARHLVGKDTWELGDAISAELGLKLGSRLSVFGIGPAGENCVRFAVVAGDQGHVAAHNGVGAVMGSKRLKAIAVARGKNRVSLADRDRLASVNKDLFKHASTEFANGMFYNWGSGGLVGSIHAAGQLPVRNYTTSVFPEHEKISGQYMRTHFEMKPQPCWACRISHLRHVRVTEGPYAGVEGEEPEYEGIAGMGSNLGISDAGAIVMLTNLADRLGMDINESSWLISWIMECYGRGLISKHDVDGLEVAWGDAEVVKTLLQKIARRDGCGDWLAEGVMRAAQRVGSEAPSIGVYTMKGASPRSHDHRGRWYELLDTCLSNTSTIEASFGMPPLLPGKPQLKDPFSPEQVAMINAVTGGWRQFEDCLGVCRFCSTDPQLVLGCVNAVTGWSLSIDDTLDIGRRAVNLLRLFNLRHGLDIASEAPSPRYSSTPVDGPAEGIGIAEHFEEMRRVYWRYMGWDEESGCPLPETLDHLGLVDLDAGH